MASDLTPEELAGLRERAEKATPGPWWPTERWNRYSPTWHTGEIVATGNEVICQPVHDGEFDPAWLEDAAGHPNTAHIAGLDPETVVRLVAMAERVLDLERAAEGWCLAAMVGLEAYDAKGERPDYIGKAAKALAAEQERGARYRGALARIVNVGNREAIAIAMGVLYDELVPRCEQCDKPWSGGGSCDDCARAALAEPEGAQHGGD